MEGFIIESPVDVLPEESDYPDRGCDLCPVCLNCPLPRCRYDEPPSKRYEGKRRRDREIQRLRRAEGSGIKDLASTFGLSRRTIHRILRRFNDE